MNGSLEQAQHINYVVNVHRKIQRAIRESTLKVQAGVQSGKVRVTSQTRNEFQATMALVRRSKL